MTGLPLVTLQQLLRLCHLPHHHHHHTNAGLRSLGWGHYHGLPPCRYLTISCLCPSISQAPAATRHLLAEELMASCAVTGKASRD